jgi:Immunoglobulin domain
MKTQTSLMKRLQTTIAVLSLAACGTGIANANDLINPDLDQIAVGPQANPSPVNWQIVATKSISGSFNDGADSETFCNVQQAGGYGLFFKPFQGTTNLVNDLLTVDFYQDNPSAAGAKCTLSGYASCEPNCSILLPPPPGAPQAQALFVVEFLDSGNNVITSNALDLVSAGMHTDGAGDMGQLTTSQFTAPAGTVTVRAGAFLLNAYGTTGAQSFFVDAFDLETVYPAGFPVITNQPSATTVQLGGTATFTVGVANAPGAAYQWQLEGVNLVNGSQVNGGVVSGATSPTLSIAGTTTNNIGHYRVTVTGTGTVVSHTALLALDTFNFYPVVALYGNIGSTYVLSYSTTVNGTYIPLSTNTLTMSPQYLIDPTSAGSNTRFYQTTFLH